ncbi:D-ribose pyranase [Thermosipho ferrireducens]|uniref:D-ribose pyranase n=1 Tax=Thermosipho ferrireducens TaxID=2571116 RepID=A0ABX7S6E1_9BACT|nr:D-ribose pyranase [Thermosipho ferrireducens]QTA37448.1 D-ribose pyranase [Thermosipho ferrireducens]
MKKDGIFNSKLAQVIASMGHLDKLAIVDLGFPVPKNVERIDLVIDKEKPCFEEVLKVILKELYVEKVIVAEESNEKFVAMIVKYLPNAEILKVSHTELKKISEDTVAVVRTGEIIPYSNAILVSGVIF